MAKRFSVIKVGEKKELFCSGYVETSDLEDIDAFIDCLEKVSSFEQVHVTISHMMYMDFPEPNEDITNDDLAILLEIFDSLADDGYIYLERTIDFDIDGLGEDDIIQT